MDVGAFIAQIQIPSCVDDGEEVEMGEGVVGGVPFNFRLP